jgi:hypothetical protein
MDPDFVVQGCYEDGTVCHTDGSDDKEEAIRAAKAVTTSSLFEGKYVRVITRDGELAWDSRWFWDPELLKEMSDA